MRGGDARYSFEVDFLDAANGANVVALLGEMNRELGTTLVLVTHDPELGGRARRVLHLRDGAVVSDSAMAPTADAEAAAS